MTSPIPPAAQPSHAAAEEIKNLFGAFVPHAAWAQRRYTADIKAIIDRYFPVATAEDAARLLEKKASVHFEENGYHEPDTNAADPEAVVEYCTTLEELAEEIRGLKPSVPVADVGGVGAARITELEDELREIAAELTQVQQENLAEGVPPALAINHRLNSVLHILRKASPAPAQPPPPAQGPATTEAITTTGASVLCVPGKTPDYSPPALATQGETTRELVADYAVLLARFERVFVNSLRAEGIPDDEAWDEVRKRTQSHRDLLAVTTAQASALAQSARIAELEG